jgi:hypothetical protein
MKKFIKVEICSLSYSYCYFYYYILKASKELLRLE